MVQISLSMSLDGFSTGKNPTVEDSLGGADDIIRTDGELWIVEETFSDAGVGSEPAVANQALRAGLVDELIVHVEPVLLGAGTCGSGCCTTDRGGAEQRQARRCGRARHVRPWQDIAVSGPGTRRQRERTRAGRLDRGACRKLADAPFRDEQTGAAHGWRRLESGHEPGRGHHFE